MPYPDYTFIATRLRITLNVIFSNIVKHTHCFRISNCYTSAKLKNAIKHKFLETNYRKASRNFKFPILWSFSFMGYH
jgi:hypothetical protein